MLQQYKYMHCVDADWKGSNSSGKFEILSFNIVFDQQHLSGALWKFLTSTSALGLIPCILHFGRCQQERLLLFA